MDKQEIIDRKVAFIFDIYEMAIQDANKDLLNVTKCDALMYLIGSYKSLTVEYKDLYFRIKKADKLIKVHPQLENEWKILRYQLVLVYKGIYEILHKEYGVNKVWVDETNQSMAFELEKTV